MGRPIEGGIRGAGTEGRREQQSSHPFRKHLAVLEQYKDSTTRRRILLRLVTKEIWDRYNEGLNLRWKWEENLRDGQRN